MVKSLRMYLERIRGRHKVLAKRNFIVPKGMAHEKFMDVVEKKRAYFLERYVILMEKTDVLHDQFQYLYDTIQVKRINDLKEEQQDIEEILGGVSSYLYEQSIEEEELHITLTDHTKELDFVTSDINAQLSAEREIQQFMREKIRKRHVSKKSSRN